MVSAMVYVTDLFVPLCIMETNKTWLCSFVAFTLNLIQLDLYNACLVYSRVRAGSGLKCIKRYRCFILTVNMSQDAQKMFDISLCLITHNDTKTNKFLLITQRYIFRSDTEKLVSRCSVICPASHYTKTSKRELEVKVPTCSLRNSQK